MTIDPDYPRIKTFAPAGSLLPSDMNELQDVLAHATFSVYRNASFSPASGPLKIPYDVEEWDSHGWFDIGSSRWVPQRPGIYRLSAFQRTVTDQYFFLYVYKNGSLHRVIDGDYPDDITGESPVATCSGSVLVEANGTTDYFEIYMQYLAVSTITFSTGTAFSLFQGESVAMW